MTSLAKARKLYRLHKFKELTRLLEPQIFRFRNNYEFYYLLGMGNLYLRDYDAAYSYLTRAANIEEHTDSLLGIVFVLLHQGSIDKAIRTLLTILDMDAKNKKARTALKYLRNMETSEEIRQWLRKKKSYQILPSIGLAIPPVFLVVIGVSVFIAALAFSTLYFMPHIGQFFTQTKRDGTEVLSFDNTSSTKLAIETENNNVLFHFSDKEIKRKFALIVRYYNQRKDNLVQYELNQILLSNAAPAIKARAELLQEYLETPDFTTFTDNFSYEEVTANPQLYYHTYVRWSGRITNLYPTDIQFDLMVGYETSLVLKGVVPVTIDFPVILENNMAVEIIAQVIPSTEPRTFQLAGRNIRILAPSEIQ